MGGILANIADSWEQQRRESQAILGNLVQEHPNIGMVVVATALDTAMTFGSGTVDILRLGQGVQQRSWSGVLQDGLRLLSIIGTGQFIIRVFRPAAIARGVETAASAELGICSFVAGTQALKLTGTKFGVVVDDLLIQSGFQAAKFLKSGYEPNIYHLRLLKEGLEQLGARVKYLGNAGNLDGLKAAALANKKGVIHFAIRWKMDGNAVGHAMVAFVDATGAFKILDRSGAVVSNLTQLDAFYSSISTGAIGEMYFLQNALIVELPGAISTIAMEVNALQNQ